MYKQGVRDRIQKLRDRIENLKAQIKGFGPWSEELPSTLLSEIEDVLDQIKREEKEEIRILHLLQYAPAEKHGDIIDNLMPKAAEKATPRPRGLGVAIIPEISLSRGSTQAPGSTVFGGLPVANNGWSANGLSGGGSVRFDLSAPFNLPAGHRLAVIVGAWADRASINSGPSPLTMGLSAGSNANDVTFGGGVGYSFGSNYVIASGLIGVGAANRTLGGMWLGSSGSSGSSFDLAAGHVFGLWSVARTQRALLEDGWKTVALDVSGHVGLARNRSNGYVDTLGTFNGSTEGSGWAFGPNAELSALYKSGNILLTPSLKVGVDFAPGQKTWTVPSITVAGGIIPSETAGFDRVRGLVQGGLAVTWIGGATVAATVAYRPGSSTNSVTGKLSMKVPLDGLMR